jgi:sugar phosphate isomerase/epimerase
MTDLAGNISRRRACGVLAAGILAACARPRSSAGAAGEATAPPFRLRYVLSSALYGTFSLEEILPEVRKTGSESIDIWCRPHGNQREQIDEMGIDAFASLLEKHEVALGLFTRYPLGPFGLRDEMKLVKRLGGKMVLSGPSGPRGLTGADSVREVKKFLEKMKPHVAAAQESGITIAVENHGGSLLSHPDSIRAFGEINPSPHLGIAFAPHHLHPWPDQIPKLIEELGRNVVFVYAQEHGRGSKEKPPKEQDLTQLPGFGGGLDYRAVVAALRKINYQGPVEIFMHPIPRGVPILPTVAEITAAVNKSREYLQQCLEATASARAEQ